MITAEKTPIVTDDRTAAQKKTHTELYGGKDRLLSGRECYSGASSYAYWACKPCDLDKVKNWVESRGDITRPCYYKDKVPYKRFANVHIYFVYDCHPALL